MKSLALLPTKHMPVVGIAKAVTPPFIWSAMYRTFVTRDIPDAERYGMVYRPWMEPSFQSLLKRIDTRTMALPESCWQLRRSIRQSLSVDGAVYELGVYKGGTARLLREELEGKGRTLRLFDTFAGMERTHSDKGDRHRVGDFADTSVESVRGFVGDEPWIDYRAGWVPDTFAGIPRDEKIAFAHIDLDLHDPILSACDFVYPRLNSGAALVFDDYGGVSTAGARKAIDAFFADKSEEPIILQTGQAIVIKL